ncbi:MAG: hypothetical protein JTT11_00100 [Candidatus Brockarchaeota archaeon]|nr:hypothetical protein [Candidatus Brockarchaeota archaeon]
MKGTKVLAFLAWALMSAFWFNLLLVASGPWGAHTPATLLALAALSAACFLALWRLVKDRQTLLLATSIAGMATFLAAYFATMLPAVLP